LSNGGDPTNFAMPGILDRRQPPRHGAWGGPVPARRDVIV
jgi:hypothetical protein